MLDRTVIIDSFYVVAKAKVLNRDPLSAREPSFGL
jgi:hypothetical protein